MSSNAPEAPLAHMRGIERFATSANAPRTFPEILGRAAKEHGSMGIQMLDRMGRVADRRSYVELLEAVERAAGRWRSLGVGAGERLLLCLPTSWDFLDAWLGAICIGAYPAAIANVSGGLRASSNFAERLAKYKEAIGASRIVIGDRMAEDLREAYPNGLGAIALTASEIAGQEIVDTALVDCAAEDLAFLQFTSGSTGAPRAVRVSHGMASHNAFSINEALGRRYGAPASDWGEMHSSWLPMHHDMGLVGCVLLAIANGLELRLMNPNAFLARPLAYLKTLHGKKAMMSGPNFGYQFCVDRLAPEDLEGLDLSQVGVAMTGSEMIRPETMEAFCALVKGAGFTPDKAMPCYGMAEATLAVTFDVKGEGVRTQPVPSDGNGMAESTEVVCCGVPVPDTEVRIANAAGETIRERQLGEVLVKGPAVFKEYYNNPEASEEAKCGQWLRTGDIGFVVEGELYIAGRSKETLVIRGETIMPHEIEWLAEGARVRRNGGERIAAFSVPKGKGGEGVVLVVEIGKTDGSDLSELDKAIRSAIGLGMSVTVSDLIFVRRGRIPRTSSGKIQRGKIKQDYLEGKLDPSN